MIEEKHTAAKVIEPEPTPEEGIRMYFIYNIVIIANMWQRVSNAYPNQDFDFESLVLAGPRTTCEEGLAVRPSSDS